MTENTDNLWTVDQVAKELNCTISTINFWYRFKKQNPDNEYAKELPEYTRFGGSRGQRLWTKDDIASLKLFQKIIPHGRNGILGSVTQKYQKH